MDIYLPIAEQSVNALIILAMGAGVGMMSGIFGVGGGFLMTPLLMFYGIPPAVAVGTEANQIVASSVSGVLAHWKRGNVDLKMGLYLVAGGITGVILGQGVFVLLRSAGIEELGIKLAYVVFLGIVGALMFVESLGSLIKSFKKDKGGSAASGSARSQKRGWIQRLPYKVRFRTSKVYISALLPVGLGLFIGILAVIMGVGGGFVMVPAMIYIIGMPTSVVVGTSLFYIIFATGLSTFMHAYYNHTVDIVLALLLLVGGVIGAQVGTRVGANLKGEQLRILLAMMVLGVCIKLALGLVLEPDELFSIGAAGH